MKLSSQKRQQSKKLLAWQLPKGIGISPKLFMCFSIVLATLLFVVLAMIFHYRNHTQLPHQNNQDILVTQQSGISPEAAIRELDQKTVRGILIRPNKSKVQQIVSDTMLWPSQRESSSYQNQQESQAACSPISVVNNYHGPLSNDSVITSNAAISTNSTGQMNLPDHVLNQISNDRYQQQNMQPQKIDFLKANHEAQKEFYLKSPLTTPISPYEIKAGTLIEATLLTGIDSDLPGQITASVSRDIYDTVTGNDLLIPQGTRVLGVYDSQVAYGQERILIAWSRLIFPNGDSFDLEGQPGADLMGMSGLHDQVNHHYMRIFGSALAFSIFGALGQLSQPKQSANNYPSNAQIIYGAIGQNLTEAGIQLMEKNMNIQPTITIRPGVNFNILLTRDMVLPGPYPAVAPQVSATDYQMDRVQNKFSI